MKTGRPKWSSILLTTFIVAGLTAALPARADISIYTGGGHQGVDNVLFNGPSDIDGPELTVTGHIGNIGVSFTGSELLLADGGQAKIAAVDVLVDGGFTDLSIYLTAGGAFTKVIFNLDAASAGTVTITATEAGGGPGSVTEIFPLVGSGQNFMTAIAINDQSISNIHIVSSVQLADVAQIRLGGGSVPVPEPSAIILLGISVLGVAVSQRSRWAKRL